MLICLVDSTATFQMLIHRLTLVTRKSCPLSFALLFLLIWSCDFLFHSAPCIFSYGSILFFLHLLLISRDLGQDGETIPICYWIFTVFFYPYGTKIYTLFHYHLFFPYSRYLISFQKILLCFSLLSEWDEMSVFKHWLVSTDVIECKALSFHHIRFIVYS